MATISEPTVPRTQASTPASSSCSPSGFADLRPTTPTSIHSSSSETGDNDIIPPYNPAAPRTLVLCFDGTGDQFDNDNSNVVKFFSLLKRDDRREQMVYYQTGIGTYTSPQLITSTGRTVSKTLDEMVAWNLDSHVMGGYTFLMQNYEAGDKICLFGFSRGAYTARALAGMLHKVGLLPAHNHQQIPFAYKMYTRTDELGWKQSTAFKRAFSIDVGIDFIGVWDTVCSVGVIPHRLPFTSSNTAIRVFRHALSLDERRAKFKANHWNRPTAYESLLGTHRGDMPRPSMRNLSIRHPKHARSTSDSSSRFASLVKGTKHTRETTTATGTTVVDTPIDIVGKGDATFSNDVKNEAQATIAEATGAAAEAIEKVTKAATEVMVKASDATGQAVDKATEAVGEAAKETRNVWAEAMTRFGTLRTLMRKKGKRLTEEEQEFNKTTTIQGETDVKEVWFAGCHCDVGGGSVLDSEKHALARIPLRWMVRECFRTETGIRFHAELLKEIGLEPAALWDARSKPYPQYGPGPVHSPQLPPVMSSPRISFDPPTPPERSQQELEHNSEAQATFTRSASTSSSTTAGSSAPTHTRHVSVSTTRTLVGTMNGVPAPLKCVYSEPQPGTVTVNELEEERLDALCPIYDQLSLKKFWWILEFFPITQRRQLPDKTWKKSTCINLGRGRLVESDEGHILIHKSVKTRMEEKHLKYCPKAQYGGLTPVWVD